MSAADAEACVACGRDTTDRYFTNARSTRLGDDARRLAPPVALCRACKPRPVGDAASIEHNPEAGRPHLAGQTT